jgi:branched-chain amino acid transport system substrate-binding protein
MIRTRALAVVAAAAAIGTIAGCRAAKDPPAPNAHPVASSVCGPVTYGGEDHPQLLIVNSGTLQGPISDHGVQNGQATKLVLAQRGWKAGRFRIGLQVCDEAAAGSAQPSEQKCAANAKAFAANASVAAVIGPVTSSCGRAMIPVLNGARGGPVPIISMSNTYLGLTRHGPGVVDGDPEDLYPTGTRNYARMAPADDVQGAVGALYAQGLGVRRPYVLHDDDIWGVGVAAAFSTTARRLGMHIAGSGRWDARAGGYSRLAVRIRRAHADGVYLGGYAVDNGPRLVRDLRDELGTRTAIVAPDGFNQPQRIIEGAGDRAEGLVITIASLPAGALPPNGRRFARVFRQRFGSLPCCFSVHAAEATNVVLNAITRSDGSRGSVLRNIFRTRVRDGLLGSFDLDRYGDTTLTKVAVYVIRGGGLHYLTAISPPPELLARR